MGDSTKLQAQMQRNHNTNILTAESKPEFEVYCSVISREPKIIPVQGIPAEVIDHVNLALQSQIIEDNSSDDSSSESAVKDWRDACDTISSRLAHILANNTFPDITFIVGAEKTKIHCHKLVLMITSSVLETLVQDMSEHPHQIRLNTICRNQIGLPNITEAAFRCFLKFIYTDRFEVPLEQAADVLTVSEMYKVQGLTEKCIGLLKCNISEKNVIGIYEMSKKLQLGDLSHVAWSFICRNPEKVINSDEFLTMGEENLCSLLQSDEFKIDELTLFNAVYKWGVEKCKVERIDEHGSKSKLSQFCEEELRLVLRNPIQLVRFPLFKSEQLTMHVAPKNVLLDTELLALYKYLSLSPSQRKSEEFLLSPMQFPTRPRGIRSPTTLYAIKRLEGIDKRNSWNSGNGNEFWKISFMVNRSISIHGYGFLGSFQDHNCVYDVEIQLAGPNVTMTRKEIVYTKRIGEAFQVKFVESAKIQPNRWYTASFRLVGSPTLRAHKAVDNISIHCGDIGFVNFFFQKGNENEQVAAHQLSKIFFSL